MYENLHHHNKSHHNSYNPYKKNNDYSTYNMHGSGYNLGGSNKDIVSHKRQCDSVLARIIYSYRMFEQFFGPFHPMG